MRLFVLHWALAVIAPFCILWAAAALFISLSAPPSFEPATGLEITARLFQNAAPALLAIGTLSAAVMAQLPRFLTPPALVWAALGFAAFVICCFIWQALIGSVTGTFLRHDMGFLLKPAALFAALSGGVQAKYGPKRPGAWD